MLLALSRVCLKPLLAGFLVSSVFVVLIGCDSRTKNGPRFTSYANLHKIGLAIRDYTDDNGGRPQHLSNLVPRYIPLDQIRIFYVNDGNATNRSVPPDWASNPSRIDQYASYVYLGTNSEQGVLAYEKMDLWKTNASFPGKVAVLFTDFHVQLLPTLQLQELTGVKVPSGK
jgi:hypothetical protein